MAHGGGAGSGLLEVVDAGFVAQVAAVVAQPEIVPCEAFQFHQREGDGVADCQHDHDARRRSESVRAGLGDDSHIHHDVAEFAQFGIRVGGYADDRFQADVTAEADHFEDFAGFPAGGESDHAVAGSDESQVAVRGLARVYIGGGSTRGAQRGGELARDVSGFADARGQDLACGIAQGENRKFELGRNVDCRDRGRLRGQDVRHSLADVH